MTMLPPLALTYAALTALALAQRSHFRQLLRRDPAPVARVTLLAAGWSGLGLSYLSSAALWGPGMGAVAWFGLLTVTGVVLVFLLSLVPRASAGLLGVGAAGVIIDAVLRAI